MPKKAKARVATVRGHFSRRDTDAMANGVHFSGTSCGHLFANFRAPSVPSVSSFSTLRWSEQFMIVGGLHTMAHCAAIVAFLLVCSSVDLARTSSDEKEDIGADAILPLEVFARTSFWRAMSALISMHILALSC